VWALFATGGGICRDGDRPAGRGLHQDSTRPADAVGDAATRGNKAEAPAILYRFRSRSRPGCTGRSVTDTRPALVGDSQVATAGYSWAVKCRGYYIRLLDSRPRRDGPAVAFSRTGSCGSIYRLLGVKAFSRLYVLGFLTGGGYHGIPLERCAFEMEQRFVLDKEPFDVEREVPNWISKGLF